MLNLLALPLRLVEPMSSRLRTVSARSALKPLLVVLVALMQRLAHHAQVDMLLLTVNAHGIVLCLAMVALNVQRRLALNVMVKDAAARRISIGTVLAMILLLFLARAVLLLMASNAQFVPLLHAAVLNNT